MAVTARTTRVAVPTVTGNQTITISGLGVTPKLAMFTVTGGSVDGTVTAHMRLGFGATDGVAHRSISMRLRDARASEQADKQGTNDSVVEVINTTNNNIEFQASWVSFNADNVIINWSNVPSTAYLLTVTLVGGDDFSVDVGQFDTHGTADSSTVVTGVGFKSDVVCCFSRQEFFTGIVRNNSAMSFGFASRDTTDDSGDANVSINIGIDDGSAAGDPFMWYANNRCFKRAFEDTEGVGVEVTAYGTDGFTATSRDVSEAAQKVGYIAMSFGGVNDFKVWTLSTPTATPPTTSTDAGPGFVPQFVMYGLSHVATANSQIRAADAGSWGISQFDATNQYSNVGMDEYAADPTNVACVADDSVCQMPDDAQAASFLVALDSMAATGPSLDWNDNPTGAARFWAGFAIEEDAAGASAIPMAQVEYSRRR